MRISSDGRHKPSKALRLTQRALTRFGGRTLAEIDDGEYRYRFVCTNLQTLRRATTLLIKEPGTPTRTPWHQDLPYWPIDGWKVCSLWLALDPVTAESGAVEYIKGSHRWGRRYKPATFSGQHDYQEPLPPVPDIEAMRDELEIVQFELQPGDCTIHHGLLVHGSPGNLQPHRRRRASVTRWAGEDVVYRPRDGLQDMPADPGIAPDGPIDCDLWPKVWPRDHLSSAETRLP